MVAWTWSGDPALPAQVARLGANELPLATDTVDAPIPLAPAIASAPWFKVCGTSKYAVVAGAEPGQTYPGATAASLQLATAVPRRFAAMRSGAAPFVTSVELELCDGHCDRYFDYQPGRPATPWIQTPACAEAAQ
jgi:hypothetical protein